MDNFKITCEKGITYTNIENFVEDFFKIKMNYLKRMLNIQKHLFGNIQKQATKKFLNILFILLQI